MMFVACAAALTLSGCGEEPRDQRWLPTYYTSGEVMINGQPANGAVIRLYPVTPQKDVASPIVPTGTVQENGVFELTSYSTGDGAPEGDYRATLEWPDPKLNATKGGMPEDPPDRLKGRFSNPKRSTIKVHVSAEENVLKPIVLEKVEIRTGSSLD